MSFFSTAFNWLAGNSISSNIAKVAMLGYASNLLSKNVGTTANAGAQVVDPGVRLQLNPDTQNKIPVLYGQAYFGGYITDANLSADLKTMHYCLTLAEKTGNLLSTGGATQYTFNDVYLNNNRVVFKADGVTVDYTIDSNGNQDISARDLVKIYVYKDSGAGIPPASRPAAVIPAASAVMPNWTALTHPMTGLLYTIVRVDYNRSSGVNGLPNMLYNLTSNMTLPGDVLYDYMTNTRYGAGIDPTEIDESLEDLNEFAATGFTYTNASNVLSTGQIDINGLVDTSTACLANMEELAQAGASWLSYDIHAGQWRVIINQPGTPVATFDDSNIIGEISISGTSLTQLHNVADVQFQNTDILDKTDFAKIVMPEASLYDNEVPNSLQVSLPFTNKQSVAIKIGMQLLRQARVDKIISFTADYSYINLTAGSLISVTSPVYGFTNKVFRIITAEETESDEGAIAVSFQCLEYDATVYQGDIAEYAIETDDGILSIGSIGKPNTPTVTKFEEANVPRLVVNSVVPSGIVDAMEYWITFDVAVPNDFDRTYIQIGTFSLPNGALLTENATVNFTYSNLGQSDFYVKVRGVNSLVTGPYSDPSGLIEYVPIVVADTIANNQLNLGGQLMTLGVLTLLNNLDDLLKIFNGEKSIKDTLKDIFFGTGDDDPDNFRDVLLNDDEFKQLIASDVQGITALNNLVDVTTTGVQSGDFLVYDGTMWVPSTTIPQEISYINELLDVDTATIAPEVGDNLVWDGVNWVPRALGASIEPCYVEIDTLTPALGSTEASLTGPYKIKYQVNGITNGIKIRSGNIKLYKSNGTLVQTVTAAACSIEDLHTLVIPFAPREGCTDYYVLMDEAIVVDCDNCLSREFCRPTDWDFTSESDLLPVVTPIPYNPPAPAVIPPVVTPPWEPTSPLPPQVTPSNNQCTSTFDSRVCGQTITFNTLVKPGPGNFYVKKDGVTLFTFSTCDMFDGDGFTGTATLPCYFVDPGESYTFAYDPDFVYQKPADCPDVNPALEISPTGYTAPALQGPSATGPNGEQTLSSVAIGTAGQPAPGTGNITVVNRDTGAIVAVKPAASAVFVAGPTLAIRSSSPAHNAVNISKETNIRITFNADIIAGTGNFYLYKGATLVQTFNIRSTFQTDKSYGIVEIGTNSVTLNPTKCLEPETVYHIRADANVVKSKCMTPFAAITDATVLSFTTISKVTPTLDFTNISPNSNSSINESGVLINAPGTLAKGTGKIKVYASNGTLLEEIDAGDSRVSIINEG
jgi:hypothetical protein